MILGKINTSELVEVYYFDFHQARILKEIDNL